MHELASVARPSAADASGRVLVVDDDAAVRAATARNLRLAGFDVVAAPDGVEALRMLRADPTIRLILLDMNMPGMDGWEFRRLQAEDSRLATIPTIVVSAAPVADLIRVDLDVPLYLRKPVSRQHLISVVAEYCEPVQPW
jgi:CheY-like chemotaxis protein